MKVAGGGSGIRTHGTPDGAQQFSRLPPSSARPSLHGEACHESSAAAEAAATAALHASLDRSWPRSLPCGCGFEPRFGFHGLHTAFSAEAAVCDCGCEPRFGFHGLHTAFSAEGVGFEPTEPGIPVQQFSRLPPSSARPPLRVPAAACGRTGGSDCTRDPTPGRCQRRLRKNSSRTAAHSSSRTPATNSQRWLRRSSWGMLKRLQAAPALGSAAP